MNGDDPCAGLTGTALIACRRAQAGTSGSVGTTFREAHPREYDQLQTWNQQQKERTDVKGIQLSEADAERALLYVGPLRLTFPQALDLYSQYIGGKANVTAPSDVSELLPPTEFNRLRAIAGAGLLIPAAVGAATATLASLPSDIQTLVQEFADKYNMPADFLANVIMRESGGDASNATGDGGHSVGLLQLMDEIPGVGRGQGYGMTVEERQDPRRNLEVGVPPIAAAYQQALAKGESGGTLWDDVMVSSGHAGLAGALPAGAGGAGATGAYGEELTPGAIPPLTPQQLVDRDFYKSRYGMTDQQYQAALLSGTDPLAYMRQADVWDLERQLDEKGITKEQYGMIAGSMHAYDLSLQQVQNALDWEIPVQEYASALKLGIQDAEIQHAHTMDIPFAEYIWARQKGLAHETIAQAHLTGTPLRQVVHDVAVEKARTEADTEFTGEWAKLEAGLPPELLGEQGFSAALSDEKFRQQLAHENLRVQETETRLAQPAPVAPATQIPAGTIPVVSPTGDTIYFDPKTQTFGALVPEKPAPAPEVKPAPLKLPGTIELVMKLVRSGAVPAYVEGREPTVGGGAPEYIRNKYGNASEMTGYGKAGGISWADKPGGMYGYTKAGDIAATESMAEAFLKAPGPLGTQTQEEFNVMRRQIAAAQPYAAKQVGYSVEIPAPAPAAPMPGPAPPKKKPLGAPTAAYPVLRRG